MTPHVRNANIAQAEIEDRLTGDRRYHRGWFRFGRWFWSGCHGFRLRLRSYRFGFWDGRWRDGLRSRSWFARAASPGGVWFGGLSSLGLCGSRGRLLCLLY